MQDIQKAQSRRGGERASNKYLLKWLHHPWTHLLGEKKWVKKFMVNMKHARMGQENEEGVEKGNF